MAIGKQKKFGNILKKRKKISLIILLSVMLILLVSYGVIFASPEDETNSTNETVSENETTQAGESENLFPAFFVAPIASLITLIFAVILAFGVLKKDEGTDKMKEISKAIREGADAYLFRQYKVIAIFVVIVFVVLLVLSFVVKDLFNIAQPFAYLTGVFYSALAGFIGMKIATRANSRTAWAAKSSLNKGLRVAFNAGTIMGMCVVGLGLFDLSFWYIIGKFVIGFDNLELTQTMLTIGMGASSMALFARVGGGIFTKAADVGADLVGKVEAGIPEDDPRNPAAIADNVGDNVGDVAGMGADLYESYIGSILATMALGFAAFKGFTPINFVEGFGNGTVAMILPLIVAGMGMIFSILGTFLVRAKKADAKSLLRALRVGTYTSTVLIIIAIFIVTWLIFGIKIGFGIFLSVFIGLLAGNVIAYVTEYYTSDEYKPTQKLSKTSETGPATIIIGGISLGMKSTAIPIITIAIATIGAFGASGGFGHSLIGGYELGMPFGLFGIGMAAVGMLSTLGITLATDAYGPVADNAGGIAEMSHLEPEVRKRTDLLDSLGNTTAATGKGFAIGSAALTALALIATFSDKVYDVYKSVIGKSGIANDKILEELGKLTTFDLTDPIIIVGLFIGAVLPFIFSAMTMGAVGRAASDMVKEVRRQFKQDKGIMTGESKPDYKQCVAISTLGAQREMIAPSIIAVATPIIVGMLLGPGTVVAMLIGALVSGFALAVMMANSGGAWDNAKKYIEAGHYGGKGSIQHKAAVVGDTVGDPFKDTSGPSINILLKLMSIVSIVFVPAMIIVNELLKNLLF